jgi:hypothetical protein
MGRETIGGIKKIALENLRELYFLARATALYCFNSGIRYDENDPKTYPIIILSYNQLYYLKQLVSFLHEANYHNIVIIDNASTYPPLLDYLDEIGKKVKVHKLKNNYGHMVFWRRKEFFYRYAGGYYAVTDPDVLPDENCPEDFLSYFKNVLEREKKVTKVGFSLNINNIPDENFNKETILKWEKKFWNREDVEGNFIAEIDTTFALYRPNNYDAIKSNFLGAIRTKPPYIATHGGWNVKSKKLTNEQKFYFSSSSKSSSWKVDDNGKLISKKYN